MTTTSFSCCKKTLFAFSAHYFTTAFLPRQPCFLNFSVSLQKVKVPDDIFRIIRHFYPVSACPGRDGRLFAYRVSTVSNISFAASTASLLPNTTRTPFAMAAPSSAACSFSSAASTAHRALRSAAIISSVMPQKYRRSVSRASAHGLRGVSSLATVPTIKSFRSFSVYSRAASSAGPFAKVS